MEAVIERQTGVQARILRVLGDYPEGLGLNGIDREFRGERGSTKRHIVPEAARIAKVTLAKELVEMVTSGELAVRPFGKQQKRYFLRRQAAKEDEHWETMIFSVELALRYLAEILRRPESKETKLTRAVALVSTVSTRFYLRELYLDQKPNRLRSPRRSWAIADKMDAVIVEAFRRFCGALKPTLPEYNQAIFEVDRLRVKFDSLIWKLDDPAGTVKSIISQRERWHSENPALASSGPEEISRHLRTVVDELIPEPSP